MSIKTYLTDAGNDPDAVSEYLRTLGYDEEQTRRLLEDGGVVARHRSVDEARKLSAELERYGATTAIEAVDESSDDRTVDKPERLLDFDEMKVSDEQSAQERATSDREQHPDREPAVDESVSEAETAAQSNDADEGSSDTDRGTDGPVGDDAGGHQVSDEIGTEILDFMTVRRPPTVEEDTIDVTHVIESDGDGIADGMSDPEALSAWAAKYRSSNVYVSALSDLELPLESLDEQLDDEASLAAVARTVRRLTDREPTELLESESVQRERERLAKSLACQTALPNPDQAEYGAQLTGLRLLDLIERASTDPTDVGGAVGLARGRSVTVPSTLNPAARLGDRSSTVDEPATDGESSRVYRALRDVKLAQQDLASVEIETETPESEFDDTAVDAPRTRFDRGPTPPPTGDAGGLANRVLSILPSKSTDQQRARTPPSTTRQQPTEPSTISDAARRPWTITGETEAQLSPETKSLLTSASISSGDEIQLPRASDHLDRRETELGTSLYSTLLGDGRSSAAQIGTYHYASSAISPTAQLDLNLPIVLDRDIIDVDILTPWNADDGSIESIPNRGTVRPLGVGEMKTIRQQLKGYELGEIGHIENILEGEHKERTHTKTTTSERTLFSETEIDATAENHLQTTERFDMERETDEVIAEQSRTSAGVTVSASYGPSVEVDTNASYSRASSSEAANQAARAYSREVTEKAVERVKKRTLEKARELTRREIEELNRHGIDNADGSGHVTGVYRFVDKVYEARVHESTTDRMLMEFVVPEPGSFYREAKAHHPADDLRVDRPVEPRHITGIEELLTDDTVDEDRFQEEVAALSASARQLQPTDLTNANYLYYAARYGAEVSPPPQRYEHVSETFSKPTGEMTHFETASIPVDDGYAATKALVSISYLPGDPDSEIVQLTALDVHVGDSHVDTYTGPYFGTIDLDDWKGSVPVIVSAWSFGWAVSVSLFCERTDRAFEEWQLETYDAIMQAYRERQASYNEAVAAASRQGGIDVRGQNPERNREIEQDELKKHAIAILKNEHVDMSAYEDMGLDHPDSENTFAELVTFFEQAFEWSALTYVFYPYYWSPAEDWLTLLSIEDTDPLFANFLTAGAARMVVPVRPGLEADIAYYLQYGQVWKGEGVPESTDDRFVPILEELNGDTDDGYKPIGEPWEVTVPTNLVALQDDGSMPEFAPIEWGDTDSAAATDGGAEE
ncbi:hypothetical protein [Natronorubrum bangense]|uniref:Uncharacterized protein n=1 Tax=Natronorubrum bangense JCM 10635 TaxID=1227500 RepID=L9WI52_9EURY|nr:hypothetical protein [Natronorubrum bangense]ELY49124.1 hypothetical protein C494_08997 [Natronorubrum bangense JCM 10635]